MKDEESIERCKELIKESHSCWIGITNQIAIETVLNLIEKQKAEIETLKRDFEIVDHECSRLEQEDIRKDMIINEMAKFIEGFELDKEIYELYCPNTYDGCKHKEDIGSCKQCIIEYFENKVKESK